MRKYFLLVFYVVVSLLIGREFHPFSLFPMYNSFPNYSYAFFLKNEKGELVPFRSNFSRAKNAGGVAHQYASFFNFHHYEDGFSAEDSAHVKEAGQALMASILQGENISHFSFDTLRLYRRDYHLNNNQINYQDDLIHEQALQR